MPVTNRLRGDARSRRRRSSGTTPSRPATRRSAAAAAAADPQPGRLHRMPGRSGAGGQADGAAWAADRPATAANKDGRGDEGRPTEKLTEEVPTAADYFADDMEKRSPRAAALPQARPDDGVGREQLLQAPHQQQIADLVPVGRVLARLRRGTTASRRSCRGTSRGVAQLHRDDVRALACSTCRSRPASTTCSSPSGKMTLDPGSTMIAFHEEVRPADGKRRPSCRSSSARTSTATATASARRTARSSTSSSPTSSSSTPSTAARSW